MSVAGSRTVRTAAVRIRGTQRKSRVRQPGPERWLLIEDLPSGEFTLLKPVTELALEAPVWSNPHPLEQTSDEHDTA